ncbi:MAG: hypothetical protein ACE5HT_05870 [Gemmatimonadales bacterium]
MLTHKDSEYTPHSLMAVLTPPYDETALITSFLDSGTELPLGAIAYAAGPNALRSLGGLVAILTRSPWTIPCIALPAGERLEEAVLQQLDALRDRLAVVDPDAP